MKKTKSRCGQCVHYARYWSQKAPKPVSLKHYGKCTMDGAITHGNQLVPVRCMTPWWRKV